MVNWNKKYYAKKYCWDEYSIELKESAVSILMIDHKYLLDLMLLFDQMLR